MSKIEKLQSAITSDLKGHSTARITITDVLSPITIAEYFNKEGKSIPEDSLEKCMNGRFRTQVRIQSDMDDVEDNSGKASCPRYIEGHFTVDNYDPDNEESPYTVSITKVFPL